jgi:predicted RNA-binding Zn-ribbon protein involved in translation (DUF1610 family)
VSAAARANGDQLPERARARRPTKVSTATPCFSSPCSLAAIAISGASTREILDKDAGNAKIHRAANSKRANMARYQCRACGFDGHSEWAGELICPRCGNRTEVRAAIATEEMTDAELTAIKAGIPGDETVIGKA